MHSLDRIRYIYTISRSCIYIYVCIHDIHIYKDGEDLFDALSRHLHRLPTLVITSLQETGKFNKFSPLFQSAMDLHASELTIANSPDAVGATEVNFQTFARLPPCTLVSHLNTAACISTLARTTSVTPSSPSISVSSSLPSSASAASRVMDVISKLKYRLTFHEYVFLLARIIDSKFSTDYSRNRLDVSSQCLNPALNNMVLRGSPSSHIDGSEGYPGQRQLASLTDSAVIHVDIDDETDSTCTSAGTISSYNESSHSLSVDAAELYPSTPSPRFSPHQQVSYRCVTPKRKQTNEALTSPTPHPLHRSRFTSDTPSRKKRRRSMTDKNTLNEMKTKLERQKTLRRQEQQQIQAQLALQSYYTQRNAQLLSNIETLKDEVEETLCQICCREQKDTVILPCTHMFYCNGCFSKLQMTDAMAERSSRCPCCRVSISGTLHLALVNRK